MKECSFIQWETLRRSQEREVRRQKSESEFSVKAMEV
jgi:hypothetical protein